MRRDLDEDAAGVDTRVRFLRTLGFVPGQGGDADAVAYEDVREGDTGPVRSHELTRTDLVVYAGASGDFNPMHTDEVAAQRAGLPSVFGHGMFTAGLLATALTDYVGIGNLRAYKVRFTKQTWPGETLSTSITVKEKRPGNEVLLECAVANEDGETKITGEAVAALPSRRGRARS